MKNFKRILLLLFVFNFSADLQIHAQIINDTFNRPALNSRLWNEVLPFCDSQLYSTNGCAYLVNRGTLLSRISLPAQIQISGRFALSNSDYGNFQVSTRTSGLMNNPSSQINDGIIAVFSYATDPASGNPPGVNNIQLYDPAAGLNLSTNFSLALNTFYNFLIVDNATNVLLYLNDTNTPLLSINTTNRGGYLLGMQSREGACGGSSISAGNTTILDSISVSAVGFTTSMVLTPTVMFLGNTNLLYSIQYVTNLSMTNWTILASNITVQANCPFLYPDTNFLGQPQRFYRVVAE